jgi:hypothetical protein
VGQRINIFHNGRVRVNRAGSEKKRESDISDSRGSFISFKPRIAPHVRVHSGDAIAGFI